MKRFKKVLQLALVGLSVAVVSCSTPEGSDDAGINSLRSPGAFSAGGPSVGWSESSNWGVVPKSWDYKNGVATVSLAADYESDVNGWIGKIALTYSTGTGWEVVKTTSKDRSFLRDAERSIKSQARKKEIYTFRDTPPGRQDAIREAIKNSADTLDLATLVGEG